MKDIDIYSYDANVYTEEEPEWADWALELDFQSKTFTDDNSTCETKYKYDVDEIIEYKEDCWKVLEHSSVNTLGACEYYIEKCDATQDRVYAYEYELCQYIPKIPDDAGPRCECGAHKVYGVKCPVRSHSQWCPLWRNI